MSPRSRLLVALVSTGLAGYILVGSLLSRVMGDTSYGQLAIFNEVVRIVLLSYVEPVNLDRAMAGARLGLTEALDGDSAYLDEEAFKAYGQPAKETDADVGLALTRRFSYLMVVSVRPGSPAEKAGLKPGDVLKTLDGKHSHPLPAPVGQRLLRGEPGSTLKLTILRPGAEPKEVSLVRERLLPLPVKGKVLEPGIGQLKVAEFGARSAAEAKGEIDLLKRQGVKKLILDLRNAGFGAPADGIKVAELFLKTGVVGKLSGAKFEEQVYSVESGKPAWDGPLAVLVDTGTAGPGEIVTAALLEAGRPVIGRHTFGRAAVQKAVPFEDGGGLVVTVARYSTPKGELIHGKGLEPTVAVSKQDEEDEEDAGAPARDLALEKALEILKAEAKKAA
jgi:carboxyl-terminal processing protease